jgi:serine/threonine protein kinase
MKHSRYHILGEVGQGQFGTVFCGSDRTTGQLFALKGLDHLRFSTQSLLKELAILVRLNHPNIVSFHGLEYSSTGRYIVMEYCQGGTLRQLLMAKVELSLIQRLRLVQAILKGIEHTHQSGVIHCDLKPENILLDVTAQGWNAKIADFGVSHFMTKHGSKSDSSGDTGSPAYMAPERFYGRYSPESDLYSIGVLLYELVSGQRPFSGMPLDVMKAHLNQPLRIPKQVPIMLKAIIRKALQKLPQHRYSSAYEMGLSLDAVIVSLDCTHPLSAINLSPTPQSSAVLAAAPKRWPSVGLSARPAALSQMDVRQIQAKDVQVCFELEHPIQSLWLRSQGCFIATQSSQSLDIHLQAQATLQPLKIREVPHRDGVAVSPFALDIEPQGGWLAVVGSDDMSIFNLAQRHAVVTTALEATAQRLWWTSRRHLLIAHAPQNHDGIRQRLQFCNRRGQSYWNYDFEGIIKTATLSRVNPNQLFAITDDETPTGLFINLQPFKLKRIPLGVSADWVCAAHWGYVLGDRTGTFTCLNRRGRMMVQASLPKDGGRVVKAIALDPTTNLLWLATQRDQVSRVQTLDLSPYLPKSLLKL